MCLDGAIGLDRDVVARDRFAGYRTFVLELFALKL